MSIPELVIREIRARPVVAPLPRPIRTASGDVLDAPLLLIDVLTDVGVTGRAYAFAYTPLTLRSLAQFVRDIAPELIGKSVSPRADAADGEASQAGRLAGIRRHGGRHSRSGAMGRARARDGRSSCGAARWRETAAAGV